LSGETKEFLLASPNESYVGYQRVAEIAAACNTPSKHQFAIIPRVALKALHEKVHFVFNFTSGGASIHLAVQQTIR